MFPDFRSKYLFFITISVSAYSCTKYDGRYMVAIGFKQRLFFFCACAPRDTPRFTLSARSPANQVFWTSVRFFRIARWKIIINERHKNVELKACGERCENVSRSAVLVFKSYKRPIYSDVKSYNTLSIWAWTWISEIIIPRIMLLPHANT